MGTLFRVVTFSVLCIWASAAAQQRGSVSGSVVDPLLSAVSGAEIRLVSDVFRATAKAGVSGDFRFDGVPSGNYTLEAWSLGFFTTTVRSVTIAGGESKKLLNIPLMIGWSCGTIDFALEESERVDRSELSGQLFEKRYGASAQTPLADHEIEVAEGLFTGPVVARTKTDASGRFSFTATPGVFRVTVESVSSPVAVAPGWDVRFLPRIVWVYKCPDGGCDEEESLPADRVITVCE